MVHLLNGCFCADEVTGQTFLNVAYHAEGIADFLGSGDGGNLPVGLVFPEFLAGHVVGVPNLCYGFLNRLPLCFVCVRNLTPLD